MSIQKILARAALMVPLAVLATRAESPPAPPSSPRSIEDGAQAFLSRNPAPAVIAREWLAWVDESGTAIWDRPELTRAQRSLVTIAVLSVLREEPPLRVHVEAGLANGLTREQIAETVMHTALYAGVPQALRGMRVAQEVFAELDARTDGDESDRP